MFTIITDLAYGFITYCYLFCIYVYDEKLRLLDMRLNYCSTQMLICFL